ncbi:MAG: DUF4349 domain-containing protein [Gemmataceae bacterium]|mgnify:CR=1 FL=1
MRHLFIVPLFAISCIVGPVGCGKQAKEALAPVTADGERGETPPGDGAKADGKAEARKERRKIRISADIRLIVTDLPKSVALLHDLVKENNGYVAQSDENLAAGSVRRASWRIRVPVDKAAAFRDGLLKLGEAEKNTTESEDVTEEYHDLKNHIKNKLAEEEALRKLLEKAAEKDGIETFLKVKAKLDEVRDYINRQEGRLKLLDNLTELATISVEFREKQKYDPDRAPDRTEAASFGRRAGHTFQDSWSGLVTLGQGLALFFVAFSPWTPALVAVGVPAWIVWRRRRTAPGEPKSTPEASPKV